MAVYSKPGDYQVKKAHEPGPIMSEEDLQELEESSEKQKHPLDDEEYQRRLRKAQEWFEEAKQALSDARQEAIRDHEYYDHFQWDEDDAAEVEARGQEAVVFNQIAPAVDWVLGAERRTRTDFWVLPRRRDASDAAQSKHKLLKYVMDVNLINRERSRAFEDSVKCGVGWLEAGVRSDMTREPVFCKYEDWRNIWYDPLSRSPDLRDARYIFRAKWVDLDVAMAMFPDRANQIKATAYSGKTYFEDDIYDAEDADEEVDLESEVGEAIVENKRSRVWLVECWYRVPARMQILRGQALGTMDGEEFDPNDPDMVSLVDAGHASVVDALKMQVRCMMFTGDALLQDSPSPYRHDRFPFIPIWGKRRKKDNTFYGMIRGLRSPQDDLNKRRSKALFILSSNRIVADDDASDDWDRVREEADRPDGTVLKKKGSELEIYNETTLADAHTRLMDQDSMYIQDASGVTNENLGRDTNAQSGKAIEAKQDQGEMVTNIFFDHLSDSFQMAGEILLSLIEQFYDEPREVRITGDKGRSEWLELNQEGEDGSILNDITATKADFVIAEDNYNESVRQSMFEMMSDMVTKLDQEVALQILDMVVDMSDWPGKEELVSRIRSINGMPNPYADPDDPEEMERQRKWEEAQKAKEEHERALAEAELDKTMAEAEKARAEVQQTLHEAEKTRFEAIMELAKVDTEKAKQEATRAGISFDEVKLRLEKAKTLHDIRNQDKAQEGGEGQPGKSSKSKTQGPYRERGLKSNNKKKATAEQ